MIYVGLIIDRHSFIKEMILGFLGTAFPVLEEELPAILEYELFGILLAYLQNRHAIG
jgi:hypothetical protein